MALVMLPCELPSWTTIQKHLTNLSTTRNTLEIIEGMQKVHELCNISIDPEDEEITDPEIFTKLLDFIDNELNSEERSNFLNNTLQNIINRALNLKKWKPGGGLHFSLQQQPDKTELGYNFVSSLIANAFFSTFPKRTDKSHPTLQNFNFTNFFKSLNNNSQKSKFKSLLYYFDWLNKNDNSVGSIQINRHVMSSKQWLTIEDWLECTLPLCSVQIKHKGKLDKSDKHNLQVCFSNPKIGGQCLSDGFSQECITCFTMPEMLPILLYVEALEDNEVLYVERVRHISKIADSKNKAPLEQIDTPSQVAICCMDAENYTNFPISQHEEDNILRELNKCLLSFQQNQNHIKKSSIGEQSHISKQRRLSPIGESVASYDSGIPIITQKSCSTNRSSKSSKEDIEISPHNRLKIMQSFEKNLAIKAGTLNNRKGRFIVLGSSGECLPVSRRDKSLESQYSTSSSEEFHSAKTSFEEGSDNEDCNRRYSKDFETIEKRHSFAQRIHDALKRETSSQTTSTESNYAVGISVSGSDVEDRQIQLKRGGSIGFILKEDSLDEKFLKDSLEHEKLWIDKFKSKQPLLTKHDSNKSSEFSGSSEFSSELEEVYEQFSRWLKDPIIETDNETKRELDQRDLAVVQFAGSLLKRTLSESFAGIPLTEGCVNATGSSSDEHASSKKNKLVLNARSLSLELARQNHKLAAQLIRKTAPLFDGSTSISHQLLNDAESPSLSTLIKATPDSLNCKRWNISVTEIVQTLEDICNRIELPNTFKLSQIGTAPPGNLKAISTGNWGCGTSKGGEVQLKAIIQWLAASVAGVPSLVYYTSAHKNLATFDTVVRILIDRKWTVQDLAQATLRYSSQVLLGKRASGTIFEELIGFERTMHK